MAQIFFQNGTVQGADGLDIESSGNFQELLNLHAVFSNDTDEIAAGFVIPGFVNVQGSEFTETVGCEEDFVGAVVSHHNLGPVYHGSENEGQRVLSKRKGAAVLYLQFSAFEGHIAEEVLHHAEGLGISHDRGVRINLHEVVDVCGMVRLHVLNDEVIGFRSIQNGSDVVQPLMGEIGIYGVHNGDLFILDHIGVVSHAVGNHILSLK